MQYRCIAPVLVAALLLIVCGCSNIISRSTRRTAARNNVIVIVRPASTAQNFMSMSQEDRNELLRETQKVLQRRLVSMPGVIEPSVELTDNGEFELAIPDTQPTSTVINRILSSGNLEFYYLKDVQGPNNPYGKWRIDAPLSKADAYIFTGPNGKTINSLKQPAEVLSKVVVTSTNSPVLTGNHIMPNAKANINNANHIVVNIAFNNKGTKTFREFTRLHVNDYLAVFFNGKLLTAPKINEPIPSGQAEISGFTSLSEAKETADYLNSGPLPVPLQVVSIKHL
ncbi:MAG: hypothetical protein ABFD54_05115 [Armatimonadota bacterium]|nr:hypothetical protein [bacterium]